MEYNGHELQLSKGNAKKVGKTEHDRISGEAALRMAFEYERKMKQTWRLASRLAEHAGRKTIREEDVLFAMEMVEE